MVVWCEAVQTFPDESVEGESFRWWLDDNEASLVATMATSLPDLPAADMPDMPDTRAGHAKKEKVVTKQRKVEWFEWECYVCFLFKRAILHFKTRIKNKKKTKKLKYLWGKNREKS